MQQLHQPAYAPFDTTTGALHGSEARAILLATLERLARQAAALLDVSTVSIALLDTGANTGKLVNWVALGPDGEFTPPPRPLPREDIEGLTLMRQTPLLVDDIAADPRFSGERRFRSLFCAPLLEENRILGTLTVTSAQPGAFDAQRQRVVQIFCEQATLAIGKTLQAEANAAQARELSALLDASRALTSSLDPAQVFAYIAASIRKVIACDDAVIYVADERVGQLQVVAGMGSRIERLGGASIALDDPHSIAAWVAQHRRARLSSPRFGEVGPVTEVFLSGDDLSLLCVPLISKDTLRGVIMLARTKAFHPTELSAMLNLSNIVAATLENVILYQRSQAERKQQAAIFASASDGFALVDERLTFVDANEAFARLIGIPRDELPGSRACPALERHSLSENRLCGKDNLLERVLRDGQPFDHVDHIECEFLAVDASAEHPSLSANANPGISGGHVPKRYVDFSLTPIPAPEGPRVLLVGRDMTALREMDQMKANFLSMVSHELRAPLQTISGYLDLTLGGMAGALTAEQGDFLRRARAGSEHLAALVDDLLLISRRDAGQFTLHRKKIDLAPILSETVEELELFADDASVRLISELPPSLPPVFADGPRIAQVARNLLTNAVKFTPAGGRVTVSAYATEDTVLLRVADTGVGIAPEHRQKIFDRFYQVGDAALRGRAQGQGLGLAIVQIILEGHGGAIRVESAPEQGSAFTVTLPRM